MNRWSLSLTIHIDVKNAKNSKEIMWNCILLHQLFGRRSLQDKRKGTKKVAAEFSRNNLRYKNKRNIVGRVIRLETSKYIFLVLSKLDCHFSDFYFLQLSR